jgi:hypothetical protein
MRERDIARNGRQKRQDRGKIAARNGKDVARWAAKTARMGEDAAASTRGRMRLWRDEVGMVASIMWLFT